MGLKKFKNKHETDLGNVITKKRTLRIYNILNRVSSIKTFSYSYCFKLRKMKTKMY